MADRRPAPQAGAVIDLLAALTADGLRGAGNEAAAAVPALPRRRSWLARWLERTDATGSAPDRGA